MDDDTVIVLVGNKNEVESKQVVKTKDGSRLAEVRTLTLYIS